MFVSTFHSRKIAAKKWRIHALEDFMESLNQEQGKLVQMDTIKYNKDQSLSTGVSNQSKGKKKVKDLKKQREKDKKHSTT